MKQEADYKPTESQIDQLAKAIRPDMLADFYSDPKNQADFEAWLKERKEKHG